MAEKSNIAWCTSTFNPWIGCTRVSPGCDGCYAAVSTPARAMGIKWGAGEPRRRTSASNWAQPLRWNQKQAAALKVWNDGLFIASGDERYAVDIGFIKPMPWRVFCASLADVFDNEAPDLWRHDLLDLIYATPNLSWLLVTKRIGNVVKMVPEHWPRLGFPKNVRVLITVVNQEEADRDIPKLLALPVKNGVSYEPALGPVDWHPYIAKLFKFHGYERRIQWIIVGGESSQGAHKARPFDLAWARSTVAQCKAAGVPVFVKQLGSFVTGDANDPRNPRLNGDTPMFGDGRAGALAHWTLKDRAGADPVEWPVDLCFQEFPSG